MSFLGSNRSDTNNYYSTFRKERGPSIPRQHLKRHRDGDDYRLQSIVQRPADNYSSRESDADKRYRSHHYNRKSHSTSLPKYGGGYTHHGSFFENESTAENPLYYYHEPRRKRIRSESQSIEQRIDKKKLQKAQSNLAKMVNNGELSVIDRKNPLGVQTAQEVTTQGSLMQWTNLWRGLIIQKRNKTRLSEDEAFSDVDSCVDDKFLLESSLKKHRNVQFKVKYLNQIPNRTDQEIRKDLFQLYPVSSGSDHRSKQFEWIPFKTHEHSGLSKLNKSKLESKEPRAKIEMTQEETSKISCNRKMLINFDTPQKINTTKVHAEPINESDLKQTDQTNKQMQISPVIKSLHDSPRGVSAVSSVSTLEPLFTRTKKNQFENAEKINDGVGMNLLLKMGWKPGQGLGKSSGGIVEPIIPSLKFDTKGLAAEDEITRKLPEQLTSIPIGPDGKHPVSMLQEFCARNKWSHPTYKLIQEDGPCHRPSFVMKVSVNHVDYVPVIFSSNKKVAKALAAAVCLQSLGLLSDTKQNESAKV